MALRSELRGREPTSALLVLLSRRKTLPFHLPVDHAPTWLARWFSFIQIEPDLVVANDINGERCCCCCCRCLPLVGRLLPAPFERIRLLKVAALMGLERGARPASIGPVVERRHTALSDLYLLFYLKISL